MRRNYIVTYDICDAKRLRKVFKILRGYGYHLQFSVFECDLTSHELSQLKAELKEIIHHNEDQVLFIDLGTAAYRGERIIFAIGQNYQKLDESCFIV